jgi:mono/diheme cytochrome c family protein
LKIGVTMGLALACLLAGAGSRAQAQGQELAGRLGCLACHSLHGQGGQLAAPLDGVGSRLTPRELGMSLAYPRKRHPQAQMPSYAYLPPLEQEAVVKFLETLK